LIVVKDKNLSDIGILENAFNVGTNRLVNELWTASFSLPKSDIKNTLCNHLNYIEITSSTGRYYGLYRIMPTETIKSASDESVTYTCEHVLATLLDDVMDGYYQFSGYRTSQVLQGILDLQETKRWALGQVDFNYYFEYSFENENGLLAPILSLPMPFDEAYEFTFDTQVYPWKLNLTRASDEVKAEIRWGKDMIEFNKVSDPTNIVNYLIPKGSGEGVNQLDIARVNSGLRYIKDDESIAKWGKRSYIWIDKKAEDAQTLLANAQSLLNQWKDPKISFEVGSADLSILPEYAGEQKVLNGVTRIIVDNEEYLARIVGEEISDLSKEYEVKYQINNKVSDIATTQAETERKIQVNEAYSQGATNVMTFSNQDNCDPLNPVTIPFYIDDDIVNVNTCDLSFRTRPYKAYSKSVAGGGEQITTSRESSLPLLQINTGISEAYSGDHRHKVVIGAGWADHTHQIDLPEHAHSLVFGISTLDKVVPSALIITVDGQEIPESGLNADRLSVIDYLKKENGKVTRGLHEITIRPSVDGIARIEANVILRVFIQSRIGGVY
jgi:phage minor structural protein